MKPAYVVGASAISPAGAGRSSIGAAVLEGKGQLRQSRQLAGSHPNVIAAEVTDSSMDPELCSTRMRARMSRAAQFAAIAARDALAQAAWRESRSEIGYFLGVGASGGSIEDIEAILAASVEDSHLSMCRLGEEGLAASNPLSAFQSLHNFTLCHSAILEGVGGPNAAFFSRGAGTVTALEEAMWALETEECSRALVGGADTALHPLTWAELCRGRFPEQGLVPAEGAGVLALSSTDSASLAAIEGCCLFASSSGPLDEAICNAATQLPEIPSHLLIAPWGEPARCALRSFIPKRWAAAKLLDATEWMGESLAAGPALAWVAAVELIARRVASRVAVVSAGIDGDVGLVVLRSSDWP